MCGEIDVTRLFIILFIKKKQSNEKDHVVFLITGKLCPFAAHLSSKEIQESFYNRQHYLTTQQMTAGHVSMRL